MSDDLFRIKFWGVRGSIPVSGLEFQRYGGNTSCIEVRCGDHKLIFDAGSGLREAGLALLAEGETDIDLLFTHCHYDHIIGLPFFKVIYNPANNINIWSGHLHGNMSTRDIVDQFISPPWFPVRTDTCKAQLNFRDFKAGDEFSPRPGIRIRTFAINHPGGCIGYRIEWKGRVLALVYDIEHEGDKLDPVALELMADADLAVYDCTYTEDEMQRYRGFGHSTWPRGVKLAEKARTKRLAMFHHAPSRTDEQMEQLERDAQAAFPGAFAARDGQVIDL